MSARARKKTINQGEIVFEDKNRKIPNAAEVATEIKSAVAAANLYFFGILMAYTLYL
jgi:hypothetical protein